jgi:hypothetical protein
LERLLQPSGRRGILMWNRRLKPRLDTCDIHVLEYLTQGNAIGMTSAIDHHAADTNTLVVCNTTIGR